MGKIYNGILGPVSGKVGPVVFGVRAGEGILRSQSRKRTGPATPKQLDQQARFGAVGSFLRPLRNLIRLSYTNLARGVMPHSAAQSLTYERAIIGTYPNYEIDPAKVLVAVGSLENVDGPTAAGAPGGTINFSWTDNSGYGLGMEASDRAILVAYNLTTKRCTFTSGTAMRNAGAASLVAPHLAGQAVHTWIAFMSESGRNASDSIYTGLITLP